MIFSLWKRGLFPNTPAHMYARKMESRGCVLILPNNWWQGVDQLSLRYTQKEEGNWNIFEIWHQMTFFSIINEIWLWKKK